LTARENRIDVAKLLLKHNAPINAQTVVCNDYVLMQGKKNPVPKFCLEEGEPRLDNNLCLGDFVQTQKKFMFISQEYAQI